MGMGTGHWPGHWGSPAGCRWPGGEGAGARSREVLREQLEETNGRREWALGGGTGSSGPRSARAGRGWALEGRRGGSWLGRRGSARFVGGGGRTRPRHHCEPLGLGDAIDDLTSWPPPAESGKTRSLLAIAAGIKQKEVVDTIATKFFSDGFSIMIFHYDGVVVHVSAVNQTKWWFAKRFLHPDIVHEYDYIFVWDEDLGVQHFHPARYVAIVEKEGLQISQPALDATNSKVHHWITARARKGGFHRRIYKQKGATRCYENSTAPPCTGFVEMMAPVFSRAAWHCVWHMIQNDLIHAWGLDFKFGYCAQGDRSKNVGVVDSEYLLHLGIPTLGSSSSPPSKDNKSSSDAAPGDESEAPIESMMAPLLKHRPASVTDH
ncbi:uncharacterized protein LOC119321402 [Triticum dicoccoides]|uniref:uncharacterized protein LOC119321402 n=1 Tax=Triticum dicoccoides TaxID=85692 RepID=UPI001890C724|nr:uncharacterized protein LOC119321402 [Triticum dicoccoides]